MINKSNPKQKIIQRMLVGGVVLGIMASVMRMIVGLVGMSSLPTIMNTVPETLQSDPSLLSVIASFVSAVSPYLLAAGAFAAFLYVYLFRDGESQNILMSWGVLMVLHLVLTWFFAWL
ncbi:MAG TPA: hypothetical protein VFO38_05195 [Candidatus Saccharimonadales bacterium]|nr:hypothetical protein [Candidatus Saccharimonadales bacterium]